MNKRLKELKAQARDFYLDRDDLTCSVQELHELVETKFAELIVLECANLVGGYVKENEFGAPDDVKEAYDEITKHFGVK